MFVRRHVSAVFFCVLLACSCSGPAAGPGNATVRTAPGNGAVNANTPPAPDLAGAPISNNPVRPPDEPPPKGSFLDRLTRRREVPAGPSGTPVKPVFRPAGENSQFAVLMDPDGRVREIRTFKGHPALVRVDAVWVDPNTPNQKRLEFKFRNGRNASVTTDQVPSLKDKPVAELLSLVPQR
jgi:hypothetical protein